MSSGGMQAIVSCHSRRDYIMSYRLWHPGDTFLIEHILNSTSLVITLPCELPYGNFFVGFGRLKLKKYGLPLYLIISIQIPTLACMLFDTAIPNNYHNNINFVKC